MNFGESIHTCLIKKFAHFKGRASRSEFWYFQLFIFIASLFNSLISNASPQIGAIVSIIISLVLVIPYSAVTVRRLHDVNKSGWYLFLYLFICFAGLTLVLMSLWTSGQKAFEESLMIYIILQLGNVAFMLFNLVRKGTQGKNRYDEWDECAGNKNN